MKHANEPGGHRDPGSNFWFIMLLILGIVGLAAVGTYPGH